MRSTTMYFQQSKNYTESLTIYMKALDQNSPFFLYLIKIVHEIDLANYTREER